MPMGIRLLAIKASFGPISIIHRYRISAIDHRGDGACFTMLLIFLKGTVYLGEIKGGGCCRVCIE